MPRVRVEHDIDEADKLCSCGCQMHRMKELISEQYDIVPARFQIIENVRFVYGCRCGAKPKTTLQVLNEKNRKATQKSYIWLGVGMDKYPVVYMKYADNRSGTVPTEIFTGFNGYLQTDGYQGYNPVVKSENITQLGCWAHARRKFADIVKSGKSDEESKKYANEAIILIRKLYRIEKEIKDDPPDKKLTLRKEKPLPIINDIRTWIDSKFFKSQKLGVAIAKAFVYLNNQFIKLKIYLDDGRLSIDNNKAENHVRPIALGRKNWLFATSVKGADAIANWYSIIETAKLNGLEPYFYLKYLLTELPIYQRDEKNIEGLLPWNVDRSVLV